MCRITFIAVSDPEDQDTDCEELGAASVDLNMVYVNDGGGFASLLLH